MKSAKKEPRQKRLAYRVDEVADLLGVSLSTIYRAIKAGQIKTVKVSSTYVIPVSAVNELLGTDTAE